MNRSVSLKRILLVGTVLVAGSSAEVLTTAKGRKTLSSTIVEYGTSTATNSQICVFKNTANSWCFN
jgi:hypothetical protein